MFEVVGKMIFSWEVFLNTLPDGGKNILGSDIVLNCFAVFHRVYNFIVTTSQGPRMFLVFLIILVIVNFVRNF